MSDLRLKLDLIMTKVEILKLKANVYVWACETDEKAKEELEKTLVEIDLELKKFGGT